MIDEKLVFLDATDPKSEERVNAMIAEGFLVFSIDPIPGSTHAIAVLRWGGPGRRPKAKGAADVQAS